MYGCCLLLFSFISLHSYFSSYLEERRKIRVALQPKKAAAIPEYLIARAHYGDVGDQPAHRNGSALKEEINKRNQIRDVAEANKVGMI